MGSALTATQWFVAETQPRSETRCRQHLEQQQFACFLPKFRKTRRHARRAEQILAPVFPGYIFVSFDLDTDHWTPINSTVGIRRLVSFSRNRPQPVPDQVIEALLSRCGTGEVVESEVARFAIGQRVRVVDGPLSSQIATIEHLDDRGRVRVLLDLLGGSVSAQVSASHLGLF